MIRLAVTQRVDILPERGERRDALDQRWSALLDHLGFLPLLMPNRLGLARTLWDRLAPDGLLLTGGNDLEACGGNTPERDATETALLERALGQKRPVLGVCRGMQVIQHHFGVPLARVEGHVTPRHPVACNGETWTVNSYHQWGATETADPLVVDAVAEDGVIEALHHRELPVFGLMWHPERDTPFSERDLSFIRKVFQP